jgi:L-asparaginase II
VENNIDAVSPFLPVVSLFRGDVLESIHYGAVAVTNNKGELIASYGDIENVTYLRSSAKPFQILPFLEIEGELYFDFSVEEIALMCASHAGTNEHVRVAKQIQAKIGVGVDETGLLCGAHYPYDEASKYDLIREGVAPSPNHNNCSGKHSGMMAYAYFKGLSMDDYVTRRHPIQKRILTVFANMCEMEEKEVHIGIDGCSAPSFAVPLKNAALAWAKLTNPKGMSGARVEGCQKATGAMLAYPEMISGPGRFDTELMKNGNGKIISKGGAEGFQAIGLMEGAISPDSEAMGIAIKISDGDGSKRAAESVALSVLQQMGALNEVQLETLAKFGPSVTIKNVAKKDVGRLAASFELVMQN